MSLIAITNDLYDIARRLRSINDDYRVYYNTRRSRYEVHDISRSPDTFQFAVPFDELDARTVTYALYSRVENADSIFAQMERDNAVIERDGIAPNCKTF